MPRNGSGVFSRPAGTTPTNGDELDAVPYNLLMDDFVADLNTARPIAVGGTGASDAETAVENLGFTTPAAGISQLSGRNIVINGTGRINQRAYVSGTATTAANQFTLDRWFVISSGQNLTFTGTDAGRVMTAPAGGVAQVIVGANIVGGTYVINWTGTATCTVGGTARAKGDTFTLTENTNATVKFTSGTFSEVQVELGTVATPFERRSRSDELFSCMDYYRTSYSAGVAAGSITDVGAHVVFARAPIIRHTVQMSRRMRATPTVVWYSPTTGASGYVRNAASSADHPMGAGFASASSFVTSSGTTISVDADIRMHFTAEAELTA